MCVKWGIDFQNEDWNNSRALCHVSNCLAHTRYLFGANTFQRSESVVWSHKTIDGFEWKLMMVWKWWSQKFWFIVCQNCFFGSINFRYSGKMFWLGDRAYFECWRFVIRSPLIVFTAKYLCPSLKKFESHIPLLVFQCTVICTFWSKTDNVCACPFSASTATPFRCTAVFFHRTSNSKVDVNTIIEF